MFCPSCGTELLAGAKFCVSCGKPVPEMAGPVEKSGKKKVVMATPISETQASDESVKAGDQIFTLTVKYHLFDLLPANTPIEVIIDGGTSYKVDEGKAINIPLTPGEHRVSFYAALRNKNVTVVASRDRTLVVKWTHPIIGVSGLKITEEESKG